MEQSKLDHVVMISRAMSQRDMVGGELHGKVKLDAVIRKSLDAIVEFGLALEIPHASVVNGEEFDVEFSLPRGESEFFAESWEDFLGAHNFQYQKPEKFYVLDGNFYSEEKNENVSSRRYAAVITFLEVLMEVADYVDKSVDGLKLIYLSTNKLEIFVSYGVDDLRDCPKVGKIKEDILGVSVKHQDQRKAIIKVILQEILSNTAVVDRFSTLLNQFQEFLSRYKDSYDLYVAEFSFEKILAEVNSNKLDYTIKLNKVFSDIQGQLLAIPAALILVGGKLTYQGVIEWQNCLTMFGCIIFVVLMDMLVRNQYNSLRAIRSEIDGQYQKLIAEHAAVFKKLKNPYEELEERYIHQRFLIRIVDGLVAAMFLFCVVLFYWYSTGRFHWVKYLIW